MPDRKAKCGATAIAVIVEAIRRFAAPHPIQGVTMFAVAAIGLSLNVLSAWILSRGGAHSINQRAAAAHVLADVADQWLHCWRRP